VEDFILPCPLPILRSSFLVTILGRDRTGLAFKPMSELLRRNLDGDIAPELRIVCPSHLAHATLPMTETIL
jgi:hypothetical protein